MALKVILVIAALLVWLCLTRVGVQAAFAAESITVDARIGWIRFRAYPRTPKKKKASKQGKETPAQTTDLPEQANQAAEKANKKAKRADKKSSKRSVKELAVLVRSAVEELFPPVKRALVRIGKGIRIKPLQLYLTIGAAEDPAAGAQLYGEVNAAVWTVMPAFEELADIREPYIQTDIDFDAHKTTVHGVAGVSIRIGTLLAAAIGIGIPVVRWARRLRKQNLNEKNKPLSAESAAAGETVE